MKYSIFDIAKEIGFTETWIRTQERNGSLKLRANRTRGQGQKRMFDQSDRKVILQYAKSKLNRQKVEAQWRLLHG